MIQQEEGISVPTMIQLLSSREYLSSSSLITRYYLVPDSSILLFSLLKPRLEQRYRCEYLSSNYDSTTRRKRVSLFQSEFQLLSSREYLSSSSLLIRYYLIPDSSIPLFSLLNHSWNSDWNRDRE